jgi:hypothetical protein
MTKLCILLACCIAVVVLPAIGESLTNDFPYPESADISHGYRVATNICRPCHVVGPQQTSRPILPYPGPTFESIANRPGMTVDTIEHFLTSADWDLHSRPVTMPNKRLSSKSMTAVSEYIMSLKANS